MANKSDVYEIKEHSAYIAIWKNGFRIAKVPIKNSCYGLMPEKAVAMAHEIVDSLKLLARPVSV